MCMEGEEKEGLGTMLFSSDSQQSTTQEWGFRLEFLFPLKISEVVLP